MWVLSVQLAICHASDAWTFWSRQKSLVPTAIRIPDRPISSLDTIPTTLSRLTSPSPPPSSSSSSLLPIRPKSHISQLGFIAIYSTKAYGITLIRGTSNASLNNARCWQSGLILDGLSLTTHATDCNVLTVMTSTFLHQGLYCFACCFNLQ